MHDDFRYADDRCARCSYPTNVCVCPARAFHYRSPTQRLRDWITVRLWNIRNRINCWRGVEDTSE